MVVKETRRPKEAEMFFEDSLENAKQFQEVANNLKRF